jgi:hypothetical protein
MYFQRNCMRSTKMTKKKVRTSGPIKDFITSKCSFFTAREMYPLISTKTKLTYFEEVTSDKNGDE